MQEELDIAPSKGYLHESLSRSTKQIRSERGADIYEDLEMTYKRGIEDLNREIKKLDRKVRNMFDFSPTNTFSLMLVKDISSDDILEKDLNLAVERRNLVIKLELLQARYNWLFVDSEGATETVD